jgi:hypothetical protein
MSKLPNYLKRYLIITLLHTSSAVAEPIVSYATGSCQVSLAKPTESVIRTTSQIYDNISTVCHPQIAVLIKAYDGLKNEMQIPVNPGLQGPISDSGIDGKYSDFASVIQISIMPIP